MKPTDLIWQEGLPDWVPAAQAKALFPDQTSFGTERPAKTSGLPLPPVPAATAASTVSPVPTPSGGNRRIQPIWVMGAIIAAVILLRSMHSGGGRGGSRDALVHDNFATLKSIGGTKTNHGSKFNSPQSQGDGEGGTGVFGSPYRANYKIVNDGERAILEVTVRGPAAKLGVVLTDPKGESASWIIQKEEMISNSHTEQLYMRDAQEGTYALKVRTIEPEKTVWQTKLIFSLGQLLVKEITFGFETNNWMGQFHGYQLANIQIYLQKTGNLPIHFMESLFTLDGNDFGGHIVNPEIVDQESILNIAILHCPPTKKQIDENKRERSRGGWLTPLPPFEALFDPGERYLLKGKIFYGKDHKSGL